jgi:hypothetical protein
VIDGGIVLELLHAYRCRYDFMKEGVPVQIDYLLMNYRSNADEMSPR